MPITQELIRRNSAIIEELHECNDIPRSFDLRVDVGALHVTNPELLYASVDYQTNTLVEYIARSNAGLQTRSFINLDSPASNEYSDWSAFLKSHTIDRHSESRVGELHVSGLPLDQPVTRNIIHGSLDQLAGWVAGYQLLSAKLFYQPLAVLRARTATIAEHHLKQWDFTTYPSGYPNGTIVDRPDLLPALARDPGLATDPRRTKELEQLLTKPVVVGLVTPQDYLAKHDTGYSLAEQTITVGSTKLTVDTGASPHQAILRIDEVNASKSAGQDDVLRGALLRLGARLALVGKDTVVAIAQTHPLAQSSGTIPTYGMIDNEIYFPTMVFAHTIGMDIAPNPPLPDYAIAQLLQKFT